MRLAVSLVSALVLAVPAAAATSRLLLARGSWAAFDRGSSCEAVARPFNLRGAADPSHAAVAFDRGGPRQGQLYFRLRRPVRPGSVVIVRLGSQPFLLVAGGAAAWSRGSAQEVAILAALRTAGGMRLEARGPGGGAMVDRYALAGAPAAIDSAAAACSIRR